MCVYIYVYVCEYWLSIEYSLLYETIVFFLYYYLLMDCFYPAFAANLSSSCSCFIIFVSCFVCFLYDLIEASSLLIAIFLLLFIVLSSFLLLDCCFELVCGLAMSF